MPRDLAVEPGHRTVVDGGWALWRRAVLRSAGLPFELLSALALSRELALPPGPERDRALHEATGAAAAALLTNDAMRSALTWQNPTAIDNWIGEFSAALQAGHRPRLSRMDRREAFVARYAQRYCAKNDTIGFFGPVAWARMDADTTAITGSADIRSGAVHFEVWAIRALARSWNAEPALRRQLPIRLDPACTIVEDAARRPHRQPLSLDANEIRLLAALPEVATVGELLDRYGAEIESRVDRLAEQGVLQVGFRVPLDGGPELHLRRQVEEMPDPAARQRLCSVLDELCQARAAVADAVGPQRLRVALAEVDRRLAAETGAPTAPDGDLPAGGRTALYLDCRRDTEASVGRCELDALAAPLGVLLSSARWLAGQVGEAVEDELRGRYRQLRRRRAEVTLADLQFAAADVLAQGGELGTELRTDFQSRWAEILPAGEQDAVLDVGSARRLADALFPAGGRLWAAAHTHSPDLLLRRHRDGRLSWVLGELHVALNTVESRVFRDQAEHEADLVAAVAADVAEGRVAPVYPSSAPGVSSRAYPPLALDPPGRYRYWSYGSDDGHPSGARSTAATALLVDERDGLLVATAERDGWAAPVIECFGEFLTAIVVNLFQPRAPRRYAPRCAIGDLTVCRRAWRLAAAEFGATASRADDPGQDRLRAVAGRLDIPRHAFFRTPLMVKPCYVDFDSPLLVDNLARAIRTLIRRSGPAAELDVVEMLPGPDELWFADPTGRRYTSELRVVAVDPAPAPAASWALRGVDAGSPA